METDEIKTVAAPAMRLAGVPVDAVSLDAFKAHLDEQGTLRGSAAGGAETKRRKTEAYADLLPIVAKLSSDGLSLRAIAARLNAEGHTTRTGRDWNPVQVSRVLASAPA